MVRPCSSCLSAITWGGYDVFYYLFSHEDSRDSFAIPHDLRILKEVFGLEAGGYAKANAYWTSRHVMEMIEACDDPTRAAFVDRVAALKRVPPRCPRSTRPSKAAFNISQ